MKTSITLSTLSGAFCASLIISNILAFKTWDVFGFTLPAAVIMFPIVYIINDILAELFEYKVASKVIVTGFIMNLIAVGAYTLAIKLPPSQFFFGQEHFEIVLSTSFRVFIASLTAYIVGSFTNLKIMDILKTKHGKNRLAFRCIMSTVFGEGIDAIIFISIAFLGEMPFNSLILMILGQALFKIVYEIVIFPVTKQTINKLRNICTEAL